jgi:hypothetical protein
LPVPAPPKGPRGPGESGQRFPRSRRRRKTARRASEQNEVAKSDDASSEAQSKPQERKQFDDDSNDDDSNDDDSNDDDSNDDDSNDDEESNDGVAGRRRSVDTEEMFFAAFAVSLVSAVSSPTAPSAKAASWSFPSHASDTDFVQTGTLDEVDVVCARLKALDQACDEIGKSAGGRPVHAFTLSSVPASRRATDAAFAARPVVLALGGIHAGEIDGKDAITIVMQELLGGADTAATKKGDRALLSGVLDAVTVVFVPVYNVDGLARFGRNQRPNQRGPAQTGWRVDDLNLNLNRDWAKADAPETRALLSLLQKVDPVVVVDLHVTDGAKFQHDVAVIVEPSADDGVTAPWLPHKKSLSTALQTHLKKTGHLPLDFYPAFDVDDDPTSGISGGVTPARLTHGYVARRGRLGVLVETHSWQPYKHRVFTTADMLRGLLAFAKLHARDWRAAAVACDARQQTLPGQNVTVAFDVDRDHKQTFAFLGYAYTRTPSTVSGGLWTRYDETKKQTWNIPLWTATKPKSTTTAPAAYAVEPAFAAAVQERLAAHGITAIRLDHDADTKAHAYRATAVTFGAKPYEGRQTAKVQGSWGDADLVTLRKGSLVVPVAQPRGRLVVELFEPAAPEALVGWGFFNAVFEQKEYMESYVAEEEARAMLQADPALQAVFDDKLKTDPAFAADAAARLDFFYRRHPAWDERINRLPVVRLDVVP